MGTKGSLKSNDFSRGASANGQVSHTQKQTQREALLAAAKAKQQAK